MAIQRDLPMSNNQRAVPFRSNLVFSKPGTGQCVVVPRFYLWWLPPVIYPGRLSNAVTPSGT
jgi:hypothetical protein